jgi:uncharacterized lipoprotein YbaY
MAGPLVRGEIVFRTAPPRAPAAVRVRLLDTSLADAPARVVAQKVLTGLSGPALAAGRIPFALEGSPPDPRARYTVSAHVDMSGDGKISRGDYINRASIPVLTFGNPSQVSVPVEPVA